MRIGIGCDTHRLVLGRKLILGGVEIPWEKGLQGHSDADVLTHAIMDALLGAAGLPNIGQQFPDTSEQFKDANSLVLLGEVSKLLANENYEIVNIDSVIMAQKPKLSPHIEEMKINVAKTLEISQTMVNVKATTGEGIGFVGREEGISVQAVCLINRKEN